jgi:hypothetical protein
MALLMTVCCPAGMANQRSKPRSKALAKRRNVPSAVNSTDGHEREKDFLTEQEIETLRKEARAGHYRARDDCPSIPLLHLRV